MENDSFTVNINVIPGPSPEVVEPGQTETRFNSSQKVEDETKVFRLFVIKIIGKLSLFKGYPLHKVYV